MRPDKFGSEIYFARANTTGNNTSCESPSDLNYETCMQPANSHFYSNAERDKTTFRLFDPKSQTSVSRRNCNRSQHYDPPSNLAISQRGRGSSRTSLTRQQQGKGRYSIETPTNYKGQSSGSRSAGATFSIVDQSEDDSAGLEDVYDQDKWRPDRSNKDGATTYHSQFKLVHHEQLETQSCEKRWMEGKQLDVTPRRGKGKQEHPNKSPRVHKSFKKVSNPDRQNRNKLREPLTKPQDELESGGEQSVSTAVHLNQGKIVKKKN